MSKEKEQRKIEINNFDNVGKVLSAEVNMMRKFIENKKPVLDKNGKDIGGREEAIQIYMAIGATLGYLENRVKALEELNKKETEE